MSQTMWAMLLPNRADLKWDAGIVDRFHGPKPVHDARGEQVGELLELQVRDDGLYGRIRLDREGATVRIDMALVP